MEVDLDPFRLVFLLVLDTLVLLHLRQCIDAASAPLPRNFFVTEWAGSYEHEARKRTCGVLAACGIFKFLSALGW